MAPQIPESDWAQHRAPSQAGAHVAPAKEQQQQKKKKKRKKCSICGMLGHNCRNKKYHKKSKKV